ncbi:3-deoxy-manno-octulosonate cytidylyltransferase [Candidatus Mcinerneyibacteriota bacterium]|nr:3-deoxy-manno-octulosonate cytidylyltransferase [Candidatus Mcinerneyibacteriota bacterium]
MKKTLVVIPARMASTRLPGKPLHPVCGKPLIRWVYEGVAQASLIEEIIVATDDERIVETVSSFGGKAVLTGTHHQTGTDRICEVVRKFGKDYDIIVNVQGDEPLIRGESVDQVIWPVAGGKAPVATPVIPLEEGEADDPNSVKVVMDAEGYALYFSRSPIPYVRGEKPNFFKHVGLYVFEKEFLLEFSSWKQTPLEKSEMLEQLRILEMGYKIKTVEWDERLHGVDTPEDVKVVEGILKGARQ